jgi:hypothetical protein
MKDKPSDTEIAAYLRSRGVDLEAVARLPVADAVDVEITVKRMTEDGFIRPYRFDANWLRHLSALAGETVAITQNEWLPIESAPRDNGTFLAWGESLIDEDFNPDGVALCSWLDDEGWYGSVWDGRTDHWDCRKIEPTHWRPFPAPPNTEAPPWQPTTEQMEQWAQVNRYVKLSDKTALLNSVSEILYGLSVSRADTGIDKAVVKAVWQKFTAWVRGKR